MTSHGVAQADQLGRVSDALAAYTECIALCDEAGAKASKAISQVKEHSEARMVHIQMQSKRTVMVRAVAAPPRHVMPTYTVDLMGGARAGLNMIIVRCDRKLLSTSTTSSCVCSAITCASIHASKKAQ